MWFVNLMRDRAFELRESEFRYTTSGTLPSCRSRSETYALSTLGLISCMVVVAVLLVGQAAIAQQPGESKSEPATPGTQKKIPVADKLDLPAGSDPLYPVLSPDQNSVAFVGNVLREDGKSRHGLFTYDIQTKATKCLIEKAIKTAPAWSPDSKKIAIGNSASYGNVYPLVIVDVTTGAIDATGVQGAGAAWSPNGRYVAVSTQFGMGGSWYAGVPTDGRIAVWDTVERKLSDVSPPGANLEDASRLHRFMTGSVRPAWSPDGNWIAWQQHTPTRNDRKKQSDVWVARLDGSGLRRVFQESRDVLWSADSTSLTDVVSKTTRKIADIAEPAPGDWPAASAELTKSLAKEQEARERAATFRADEILAANRLWQNPTLDGITSLEFTHRMQPTRLDERFIWNKAGETAVEVTHYTEKNPTLQLGSLLLRSATGERFKFLNPEDYPRYMAPAEVEKVNNERRRKPLTAQEILRRETLRYISGTRLNFTAVDWGRAPDDYIVTDYSQAAGLSTIELRPKPGAYSYCVINAGAMFATCSYAYVHDLNVQKSILTIDDQHRITHEVTYSNNAIVADIELSDWTKNAAGLQVPLRIVLALPQQKFRVEQKFRLTNEGLWILESGKSAFDGKEGQTEEIVDLKINASDGAVSTFLEKARQKLKEMSAVATEPATIELKGLTPLELGATYQFRAPVQNIPAAIMPESLTFRPDPADIVPLQAELRFPPPALNSPDEIGKLLLVLYDEYRQPQAAVTISAAETMHEFLVGKPRNLQVTTTIEPSQSRLVRCSVPRRSFPILMEIRRNQSPSPVAWWG